MVPEQVLLVHPGAHSGQPDSLLLVERHPGVETEESFAGSPGRRRASAPGGEFYDEVGRLAAVVAPALSGPLRTEAEVRKATVVTATGAQLWTDLVEAPIGSWSPGGSATTRCAGWWPLTH